MAPVYKIAVIQLRPKDVDVKDNFARAEAFIRQAAAQGADLAVLPEYHLTSWCPDHPDFISACEESATCLPRYQALARELHINIVPGTICEVHPATSALTTANASTNSNKDDRPDIEVRNMAYWITASTGELLASYQKKNLWHSERPHLTAGLARTKHRAFDTSLTWPSSSSSNSPNEKESGKGRPIRAGMLICWDLAFPEAFRELLNDGVELVIIPSFWVADGSDLDEERHRLNPKCEGLFLKSVLVTRAFENECVVVYCNAPGLSQVVAPVVGTVGGEEGGMVGVNEEGMRVVEVDFGSVDLLEREYKIKADMRGQGWHYGYCLGNGNGDGNGGQGKGGE